MDVLDDLDSIQLCVGYQCASKRLDHAPLGAEALAECAPVYEEMPGWRSSTVGVRRYEALPPAAKAYLRRMEELTDTPVDIISTGPDRLDTIVLRDPFKD